MSRATRTARPTWPVVAAVILAAVGLAGCARTAVIHPYVVTGQPSLSIDAPLENVACTAAGSCLAVGVDDAGPTPVAAGELRQGGGRWTPLVVPNAPQQTITASACWTSQCLIAGSTSSGDSLWTYDPKSLSVSVSPAPHGGRGVSAVSCFAPGSCAVVDSTGVAGDSRISFSDDGGTTWSTPLSMQWTTDTAVTALACYDGFDCLAAATNARSHVLLEVTHDRGLTWSPLAVPSTWTTLTSLTCVQSHCVALASTSATSLVVRTGSFFREWKDLALADDASALACATLTHCVVVGHTPSRGPWLATLKGVHVTNITLKYVPAALVDVACGAKVCTAIGDATVMALRP
jgi:hypothetical protein